MTETLVNFARTVFASGYRCSPIAKLCQREKKLSSCSKKATSSVPQLLDIQNDPAFDLLHADERYRSIIRKIGLPPAW